MLELTLVRDYATKEAMAKVEGKVEAMNATVQRYGNDLAEMKAEMRHTNSTLVEIRDSLRWGIRVVLGVILSGGTIGAAYFSVVKLLG